MATFTQWNKNQGIRQLTWVCGPERVLVNIMTETWRTQLKGLASTRRLYITSAHEAAAWDYLLESAPHGGRLVVVHGAEKITMHSRMELLAESLTGLSYVLFVSEEGDFTRTGDGKDKTLAPHLAAIQAAKSGQLVRCCRPSNEEDLIKLIATWWPGAGLNFASRVLDRCGGDLDTVWQSCSIARLSGLGADDEALGAGCSWAPQASWVDLLVAGRRAKAVEGAGLLIESEVPSALGLLSSRLVTLNMLAGYKSQGLDPDQIARKGIDRWQQKLLDAHASAYGPHRLVKCRKLLAVAEDAWRSGARTGVLEAIAALW